MEYTEMLKQEYLDRKRRRPAYSERAFARDLKVSAGYINLLFRGQRDLSPAKGVEIANRLSWPEEKVRHFVDSIQQKNLLSSGKRSARPKPKMPDFRELEVDKFRFIADLHHSAALTLLQSRDVKDSAELGRTLGLSAVEAELIVGRLVRLGLAYMKKGKIEASSQSLELGNIPSDAIRAFHRQAIQLAEAAIEGQNPKERNLAGLTLSLDPEKMAEAKIFLNKFLKNFERKFGNNKKGRIYQLNTQLFALSGDDP